MTVYRQVAPTNTMVARNSYAEGVVEGLRKSIKQAERERALRREEKKRKLALRLEDLKREMAAPPEEQRVTAADVARKGKRNGGGGGLDKSAYDEDSDPLDGDSSDDDDDNDNTTREQQGDMDDMDEEEDDDDDDDDDARLARAAREQARRKAYLEAKMARVESRIVRSEKRASAEGALVVHQEKVAETVLKEAEIKVNKGKKLKARSGFDRAAYNKGVEDSKNIDLDRRAIDSEK
jgi:hypothetical protein